MRDLARSAENILIPKGDDNQASVDAFQQLTGIEVPDFSKRELMAKSGGRVFWLMKGKDIPGLIAAGKGDIGMAGTDSRIEYNLAKPEDKRVRYQKIGDEMCRFSLLGLAGESEAVLDRLENSRSLQTVSVVTSRQRLLEYYTGNLPIIRENVDISGSVEAAMRLVGVPLAADIVDSGETARQNGLVEIFELGKMYPELITRVES
ncbi:hypothetical protein EPN95_00575 [Patescibacteria group bacterium]|nr:MAG: hypothetical protein EPN95_00575 [Patescibacteria group bacterium]